MRAPTVFAAAVGFCFALGACDKIPGLGKKDADGGSSGGGLFSFLDSSFEGEVTMAVSSKGDKTLPKQLVFGLKSPKIRVDMADVGGSPNPLTAGGASFILDPPTKKGYALLHSPKKAVVIDFDKAKGGFKMPKLGGPTVPSTPSGPPPEPPKIEKTGKKDNVAGYSCEIWKITSKANHAEVCVAEGIKWIDLTDLGIQAPEFAAAAAVSEMNHFPLRMVTFDDKNVETARMEATKIEKKKLDDAHFTPPADYQVVDMAQLLGQFMAPAAGSMGRLPPGFVIPPVPTAKRPR